MLDNQKYAFGDLEDSKRVLAYSPRFHHVLDFNV